ncbi:MAG: hypothetical protein JWQ36_1153, partial [Enterovirga sp.]|nr:hypothetical protein [Enterovirga sp.]
MARRLCAFACVWVLLPQLVLAQPQPAPSQRPPEQAQGAAQGRGGGNGPGQEITGRRLPADLTTMHSLELPGRTLRFSAT